MIKLLLSLLASGSVFSQTESTRALDNLSEERTLSAIIGLVGYKFYEGGFMNTRLSNTS